MAEWRTRTHNSPLCSRRKPGISLFFNLVLIKKFPEKFQILLHILGVLKLKTFTSISKFCQLIDFLELLIFWTLTIDWIRLRCRWMTNSLVMKKAIGPRPILEKVEGIRFRLDFYTNCGREKHFVFHSALTFFTNRLCFYGLWNSHS